MVQYGKWPNPPGGSNISYGSSTTVKMNNIPPVKRILDRLHEPNIFQKLLFKLFGVKDCSHFLTLQDNDNFKIMKILKEHDIQFHRFGIDQTAYYCFDLSSVNHMRIIQ